MALELQRSIVAEKVAKIAETLNVSPDNAFLRFVFWLATSKGYDELEPEAIVDGGADRQIDVLHIDDNSDESSALVTVIQGKHSASHGANALRQMGVGLEWLLEQPQDKYMQIGNKALRDRILEFRELRAELGPSNITLRCAFVTVGDSAAIAPEFRQELERIRDRYKVGLREFSFDVFGAAELVEALSRRERHAPVTDRIKIDYDRNKGALLEHSIDQVSGVVCTAEAAEIARLVNNHPSIFDDNLRQFLGTEGAVNSGIRNTCTHDAEAPLFWFLNNGITVTCDLFSVNRDVDNPYVEVKNLQIVNGCQTSTTLARCATEGKLSPRAKVMLKIFRTGSSELASRVVVTTNNQNQITSRDLKANDSIQQTIQKAFQERFALFYERKPNEFLSLPRDKRERIISNEKMGQAFLSIVLKRPSDGRRRKYKLWGEDYERVFNDGVLPQTYLLASRIHQAAEAYKRLLYPTMGDDDLKRRILSNGIFHISRVGAFIWRGGDDWNDPAVVGRQLRSINESPGILDEYFNSALDFISKLVKKRDGHSADLSSLLKTAAFDEQLTSALYRSKYGRADLGSTV